MSNREHHSFLPRDKMAPYQADNAHVKIRCSECLKAVEPVPALTVDQQDYVYHF